MSRDRKTRRVSDRYILVPLDSVRFGTRVGVGRNNGRAVSLGAGLAANPGTAVQGVEAVPTTCKKCVSFTETRNTTWNVQGYIPKVDGKAFIESHIVQAFHSSAPKSVESVEDLLFGPTEVFQVLPGGLRVIGSHCAECSTRIERGCEKNKQHRPALLKPFKLLSRAFSSSGSELSEVPQKSTVPLVMRGPDMMR